jgi:hypothetical protein
MAQTNTTIDETAIGPTIGPRDGFLVALSRTTPPTEHSRAGMKAS